MPILDTSRKHESELVKAFNKMGHEQGVVYSFASVPVKGSTTIEPIGTPLVWNDIDSAFEVYVAQDISAVAGTPALPNGAPICVTVGTKEGKGVNRADVTLSSTATEMTVMFRSGAVVADGIEFGAAAAPAIAAFRLQLEKQGIAVIDAATAVNPSFEA